MKLSRKEKEKIELQIKSKSKPIRDLSWVGIRPHIFRDKTKDHKSIRQSNKRLCMEDCDE